VVPKITVIVGGIVRRGALCDVRQGIRSAIRFCLADGALRSNGRRRRGRNFGRGQSEATGTRGTKLSDEDKKELYESTKRTYDEQTDPLWRSAAVDRQDHRSVETRDAITQALEASALNPDVPEFKVGVLQRSLLKTSILANRCTL